MLKSSTFIFLLAVSVARCQFFYNYEEDSPDYDSNQYRQSQENNQQGVQPTNYETSDQQGYTRTRIRVRSRNYPPEQDYSGRQPQDQPEVDRRTLRQERRQARKRQRQSEEYFVQPPPPPQPPKVYGPSVFENVRLGEAPSGVYVPHDSLLNVLNNPSQNQHQVQQSPAVAPQTAYVPDEPRSRFFVQPPSNEEYTRPTNLILPVSRPPTAYPIAAPAPPPQTVQARNVRTNRQPRQRIRVQAQPAPPTVDIDSYREYADDIGREDIRVSPQVEYVSDNTQRAPRPQSRRRTVTSYQITTEAPPVYVPSVFEKVGLGEAPRGIYVPQDSLLNVLRNPSSGHASSQISRREIQQVPARQPTQYEADIQNDYLPEVIEEPQYQPPPPPPPPPRSQSRRRSSQSQYQAPPPPPPPPSQSRRRSSQRTRQTKPQSQSETPRYQNEYEDQVAAQPVQPSSHRRYQGGNEDYEDFSRQQPPARAQVRSQRRQQVAQPVYTSSHVRYQDENEEYEDFSRQKPPARAQTRSQRRQEVAAPRRQPQESAPPREEPARPRKAKLAIAALPIDTDGDEIPGEAGVDYPVFHVIPKTTFSCRDQQHNGYYADMETSCQVFHLCQTGGVQNSILCPNGTIFNQEKFSCQWWYKVNCNEAPNFYIKNDELYKVPEKSEKERKRN